MAKASSSPVKHKQELLKLYRQALSEGQSLTDLDDRVGYFLRQATASSQAEEEMDQQIRRNFWQRLHPAIRWGAKLLPLLLIVAGLALAGSAAWPIISYYLPANNRQAYLLAPVPHSELLAATPLLSAQAQVTQQATSDFADNAIEPVILDQVSDFTDLSQWFSNQDVQQQLVSEQFTEYRLDVPAVNISNAKVRVGGTDLNQSLIQYPGTALPGQVGAPVIFGHSVLRQFYNPSEKNPRRYTSIFSKIMLLDRGDKIYVTHNNVKYTYLVQDNIEVRPEDTFILAQRSDVHQLKLVTCTPEGTTLRRGVVTAQLVKD